MSKNSYILNLRIWEGQRMMNIFELLNEAFPECIILEVAFVLYYILNFKRSL